MQKLPLSSHILLRNEGKTDQVLFGAKRWTLYPGSPGGVPPEAGYNPTEPHLQWLHDVYPKVKDNEALKPMECVQRAGDVIYVPEGWYHATVNLGDTGAIARRTEEFTVGSSREIGGRAIGAVMRKRNEEGLKLAEVRTARKSFWSITCGPLGFPGARWSFAFWG